MKVNPLVSVIIPTYNRESKIAKCIESVLHQTYAPIEIIVVDDGSSDNTQIVLKKFENVTCIVQENSGAANARNTGINHSNGEYIAFLDSDDTWCENKINSQISFMQQHPDYAMCVCEFDIYDTDNRPIGNSTYGQRFPTDGNVLTAFIKNMEITCSCMFIRADILIKMNGFNQSYQTAEDRDLFIRIALKHRIGVVPEKLVHYQFSHDSLSNNLATGNTIKLLNSIKMLSKQAYQDNRELIESIIQRIHINYSRDLLWAGEYASSREQLKQCRAKKGVMLTILYLYLKSYLYQLIQK